MFTQLKVTPTLVISLCYYISRSCAMNFYHSSFGNKNGKPQYEKPRDQRNCRHTTSPVKVWELLTPQPSFRALYGALFWCFEFANCIRPRYQSYRECVVYGASVRHVWQKIMHRKLKLSLSLPYRQRSTREENRERDRVWGWCKLRDRSLFM